MRVIQHDKHKEMEIVGRKSAASDDGLALDWLLNKPFGGRVVSNIRLSLEEIFKFAWAVHALDPVPGDLILDLGAGSCWVSDWLNRMRVDTISLDISHDALLVGRKRLPTGACLLEGDAEVLPLNDSTVDGIISMAATHHLPDLRRALGEMHRVLRLGGMAVFVEPGKDHTGSPGARAEMDEHGVLERGLSTKEFVSECLSAGFTRVGVLPFFYPPPMIDFSNWRSWKNYGPQRILFRLKVIWCKLLHSWHRVVEQYPIIVAVKGARGKKEVRPKDSRRPNRMRAKISVLQAPQRVPSSTTFTITVEAENTGDTLWLSQWGPGGGFVNLGAKLVNPQRRIVVQDYGRGQMSQDVAPDETVAVSITLKAPEQPGQYQVKLDMVDEGISWFEHLGSHPVFVPFEVFSDEQSSDAQCPD